MADEFELGAADFLANPNDAVLPRLKNSLLDGVTKNPDTEARMRQYSRDLNIALPAAQGDAEYVKAQGQVQQLDPNGMVLGSPRTADWMALPDNAAVAHDDIPVLSSIENIVKGIGERGGQLVSGLGRGLFTAVDAPADSLSIAAEAVGVPTQFSWDKNGLKFSHKTAADYASPMGGAGVQAGVTALQNTKLGYEPQHTWEEFKKAPLTEFIPYALEQGLVSAPDMVGVLASMPLYVASRTGEIGQTRAQNDKRSDATVGDLMAAMPAATASALLEKIGTHGVLGIGEDALKGGFRAVPKAVGAAALKEGLTESGQEGVEGLGETAGTKAGVNLGALAERMAAAGVAGVGFGGPLRAVTAPIEAVANRAEFRAAQADANVQQNAAVAEMSAQARTSALRTRDPQTFKEYVDHVTKDTPVENVYIDANALVGALAQGDPQENAKALQAMPTVARQLQEAMPGNGLIQIPTSELMAYAPDTGMAQSILENLKVDPDGFSIKEAEAFHQTHGEELKAQVDEAVKSGLVDDAIATSTEKVRQDVKAQLDAVNRFTPEVNDAYAALHSSFYAAQADRLGVTPEVFAAAHPVKFQAQGVTEGSLSQREETPEFKSWFGDSKVVDAQGAPLVVYHGSGKDIEQFAPVSKLGNKGIYFTATPKLAAVYARDRSDTVGGNPAIYPVYLSVKNPLVIEGPKDSFLDGLRAYFNKDFTEQKKRAQWDAELASAYVTDERIADLRAKGYDGIVNSAADEIVVFDPTQVKSAVGNNGDFDPNNPNIVEQGSGAVEARGAFSPNSNTITLLRNADLSTTLHELGHFYLETLARVASAPEGVPQEISEDFAKVSKFMGHEGVDPAAWLAIPLNDRREGHEKFARGFEAYLRDGKAPSAALKGPFQRFKAWLVHVYKSLSALNVELTDEVRGVFDRLIATENEIKEAEARRAYGLLITTKPEGMTEVEWDNYQALGEQATADAQDELAGRSLRDMRWAGNAKARMIRELTKEAKEKRKGVRAEVEAATLAEPVYAAQQFFKRGLLNGEEWEGDHAGAHKLNVDGVAAIYEGTPAELQDWKRLGFGKYGMLAKDGIDPDVAAELFGFSSGHELAEALLNAPPMREEVEGRTDQIMLERFGDLKDPAAIDRAADEAVHNEARMRFVATEMNALAKATGQKRILAEAARDFAKELVGRLKIRDLKTSRYTGAETRAATAAATAARKGDLATAAVEKRNQLINGYAAKAAFEAQHEVEVAMRYLARFDSAATRKGLDPDYRDQIDALLERFDLRKGQTLKDIDRRKSLASWIESQRAKGLEPVIDEDLVNEANRKHYKDLTVDELRGLIDAVKNIAHLGRLKHRLLVAADGRAFAVVVDEAEAAIRDNAYKIIPDKVESNTVQDKLLSGFSNFFAIHRKLASLMREMGGLNNDGGILWKAFVQPMNAANDMEAGMREKATVALAEVFTKITKDKKALRKKLFIPEIGRSLSLEGRLAVALNWGNELNRARIMDGDKWNAGQVDAILRTLTPDQLDFVNNMWSYLDSFWPQISAKERRVTGVTPEKVEAEPFEIVGADGTAYPMRGGYYPIKYDTERSSRSESDEIAEAVKAALRGAYTRSTTRRGHTKARVEKVERPVRKDLMVPFGHVNQVVHDLAFHEYLIDANRLMNAPAIDAAIRDHYGVETLRTIKKTLDDIAEGDVVAENSLERAVNYVRTGTTIAGLGWNLTTAMLQPLGLTQSIVRVGPKYMAKGIARAFGDAATLKNTFDEISDKSDFMRLRAKTMMREINEVQNKVQASWKPGPWGPVEASFFTLIQKLQLIADVPTWLGEYAKAQDKGHDEKTAVAMADQAVRDSQGSGQIGDLAQIQRGNAWFKLWTNFYSFFSVGYNQLAESVGETRRVGASRLPLLASDFLLVAILPSILGELLKKALRGDEWDDPEETAKQLAKAQVSYLLGFMVGARELGGIIQSDGRSGGPAGLRLLTQDLPRLVQQVEQGEIDDAFRKAATGTAGVLLHFPAGQVNRTVDGFEALARGDTMNPLALLMGAPRKKKPG